MKSEKTKKKVTKKTTKKAVTAKKVKKMTKKDILKKYPSPVKDNDFVEYWSSLIVLLVDNPKWGEQHLKNLEVLCQLYCDYDNLTRILKEKGFSYTAVGRYGTQVKSRPESTERQKIVAEIRQYSKILNIFLEKEKDEEDDKKLSKKEIEEKEKLEKELEELKRKVELKKEWDL